MRTKSTPLAYNKEINIKNLPAKLFGINNSVLNKNYTIGNFASIHTVGLPICLVLEYDRITASV